MRTINFAYLTGDYDTTPPELVGVMPLGGGGVIEAPYRHHFEVQHFKAVAGPFNKTMNVLELGSGNGRWVEALAPLVGHYTAVDFTPEAVAIARQGAARKGIKNVDFFEMSITDFRGDRPYDIIYFGCVSQYLDDVALAKVIDSLAPWIKPSTIIVDRSSLNFHQRTITDTSDYFSIYRMPSELDGILASKGFKCTHRKSSYRYMRGAIFLDRHPRMQKLLHKIIISTQPLSLYGLWIFSAIADIFLPVDPIKRGWSHDFSLYRKAGQI